MPADTLQEEDLHLNPPFHIYPQVQVGQDSYRTNLVTSNIVQPCSLQIWYHPHRHSLLYVPTYKCNKQSWLYLILFSKIKQKS